MRAASDATSKGRKNKLEPDIYRSEYQRDVHRIIHSQPFRRLKHKTQVFFIPGNDHICTRLEHSIHVASASRSIARCLNLNEDLAEAIGLAHDFGHAPFGHHGERVLSDISKDHLGKPFFHEVHGLRVVDKLAEFDRQPNEHLNLMFEVRDGIISHCGEVAVRCQEPCSYSKDLDAITDRKHAGAPCTHEGCIVKLVDRIVYAGRDIEDALITGLIKDSEVPTEVTQLLGNNNAKIIRTLVSDMIEQSLKEDRIALSEDKFLALNNLIKFNYNKIYAHEQVELYKIQASRALKNLYKYLLADLSDTNRLTTNLNALPTAEVYAVFAKFIENIGYSETDKDEQIVLDFIAGMTDNFVVKSFEEIFSPRAIT